NASLAGNAGVSIHMRSFNAGLALPTLFSPVYVSEDPFNVKEVRPFEAVVLHASNRFYFNDDAYIFEPYVVYRINTGLPAQYEVAGVLHLNHVVWAGASYRQDYGPTALGGVKVKNSLAIGASYSLKNRGIDELNSPGFEVSLTYLFGKQKRGAPVYSFVNAVRPKARRKTTVARRTAPAPTKETAPSKQQPRTATPPSTPPSEESDKPVVREQTPAPANHPAPAAE